MSDTPSPIERARAQWQHTGARRPSFAHAPGPDQESVWDYPRPPCLVCDYRQVVVMAFDVTIAETRRAVRILETGGPPTFYLPPEDVRVELLMPEPGTETICEWKGTAQYFSVHAGGKVITGAAWRYAQPYDAYKSIAGYFSFYPRKLACYVDGERVQPQPGPYYGGWVTGEIIGPFKGEPGTEDW